MPLFGADGGRNVMSCLAKLSLAQTPYDGVLEKAFRQAVFIA
jgi:hypothetical protein